MLVQNIVPNFAAGRITNNVQNSTKRIEVDTVMFCYFCRPMSRRESRRNFIFGVNEVYSIVHVTKPHFRAERSWVNVAVAN